MSCKMGVGCDEVGVCYAVAMGQPEMCAGGDARIPWIQVIDNALVCSHLGIAHVAEDYNTAERKLDELINLEVEIACDPAVNGGKMLLNREQVKSLLSYFARYDMPEGVRNCLNKTLEELK